MSEKQLRDELKVYVVFAGSGWDKPIIHSAHWTRSAANDARKLANAEYNRTKATIDAFRVECLEVAARGPR